MYNKILDVNMAFCSSKIFEEAVILRRSICKYFNVIVISINSTAVIVEEPVDI